MPCSAAVLVDLAIPIAAIMALDAVLLTFLAWAYHSPRYAKSRISPMPPLKVSREKRLLHIVGNSTLSLAFVIGMIAALYGFAFRSGAPVWWRIPVDVLAIVMMYDFLYYGLHRLLHVRTTERATRARWRASTCTRWSSSPDSPSCTCASPSLPSSPAPCTSTRTRSCS